MLTLYEGLAIGGYCLVLWLIFSLVVKRVKLAKNLEREFDGLYFLYWSFGCATVALVGFIILVRTLFWSRQSLAVGFTALLGFPGWIIIAALVQRGFYTRFGKLDNLIQRLEKLPPAEREALLRSLPAHIFSQLPGDYRIVSWKEHQR